MGNIADTVEARSQNAILSAIDSYNTSRIELAVKSKNASYARDETSVTASSERGEHIRKAAFFENASKKNDTLHLLNTNDENRKKFRTR